MKATSYRLPNSTAKLISKLSKKLDIRRTQVIVTAVYELAKAYNLAPIVELDKEGGNNG